MCIYIYIYIYIHREREREREMCALDHSLRFRSGRYRRAASREKLNGATLNDALDRNGSRRTERRSHGPFGKKTAVRHPLWVVVKRVIT